MMAKIHMKKIFNITSQTCKSNPQWSITSHLLEWLIKKTITNKHWKGYGEKEILVYSKWDCKLLQPLWKTVWRLLQRVGTELPHDTAIPLLGIYTHTPPQHTHNENLPTNKKQRYPASWDIMNGPWGQYAKWNVRQRKTNTMWFHSFA